VGILEEAKMKLRCRMRVGTVFEFQYYGTVDNQEDQKLPKIEKIHKKTKINNVKKGNKKNKNSKNSTLF
jgi:hypothetical protein